MFKYVKFNEAQNEFTKLRFVGSVEGVEVHSFSVNVVSLESESEESIDTLIAMQPVEIGCVVITKTEFQELVSDSLQINRIREVTKSKIASKYDPADEIALLKKDATDAKRVAYEAYVAECVAYGDELKAKIGY